MTHLVQMILYILFLLSKGILLLFTPALLGQFVRKLRNLGDKYDTPIFISLFLLGLVLFDVFITPTVVKNISLISLGGLV